MLATTSTVKDDPALSFRLMEHIDQIKGKKGIQPIKDNGATEHGGTARMKREPRNLALSSVYLVHEAAYDQRLKAPGEPAS